MYNFGLDHETWSKSFTEQREEIPHFIVSAQLAIWNTTSQPPLYLFPFFKTKLRSIQVQAQQLSHISSQN